MSAIIAILAGTLLPAVDKAANIPAVRLAITAAHTNDAAIAVFTLQEAWNGPGTTAQQLQAVEQASQCLTAELLRRADADDPCTKADLERIKCTRSQ